MTDAVRLAVLASQVPIAAEMPGVLGDAAFALILAMLFGLLALRIVERSRRKTSAR